jgi:putative oxidoreductase
MNRSDSHSQSSITDKSPPARENKYLQMGGFFSLAFALFQVSAVVWPAKLVASFGGPAELQIEHPYYFISLCLIIGAIAAVWGLYALSGAGKLRRLPLLHTVLSVITTIYILRGLDVIHDAMMIYKHPEQNLIRFLIFSLLALCIGLIHLTGIIRLFRHDRSEMKTP